MRRVLLICLGIAVMLLLLYAGGRRVYELLSESLARTILAGGEAGAGAEPSLDPLLSAAAALIPAFILLFGLLLVIGLRTRARLRREVMAARAELPGFAGSTAAQDALDVAALAARDARDKPAAIVICCEYCSGKFSASAADGPATCPYCGSPASR
ncbi:MAG: hypothetical protein HYV63_16045 [Candidatus Schekmanbacteria bacterium]|nr:hypothetical protein [Candidatus Schekmanbacteria bacterium]